ncbi:unnamed protein product (macronuclear) [Paramecium tetraurelia]|uniref:Exportin-1 C-terminal domain-containing protein n=1 Tax=Paramecium tetraurelia TaxID=5888 RepID=A0E4D5_PARTE|nr:uncharacterized protein GSPATT00023326001 [Paramecium tetraurelia]CAK90152.1 unnamed protein product [Paramecium tetraurelia]|eukprot:XP_001457549.1 hypothetical protein (macronuclear) [Paramecium tetraurelia strain d4-2]
MQQFFINELQKKPLPDILMIQFIQALQFPEQIEQLNFSQIEQYLQQLSILISEKNDQKCWIYFGLLLRQMLNQRNQMSIEQYNRCAINTFVLIIQILNIHITSEYIENILTAYYEFIDRVDDQFWIFLAWQFRNASNNINQLELLKHLVISQSQRNEFLDILILKIKIEIEKPITNIKIHKVIISSLQVVLERNPYQIISQNLLNYMTTILASDIINKESIKSIYYVIGLIDSFFEHQHLVQCDSKQYDQFTQYLFQYLLNQIEQINWQIYNHQSINKENQKENFKLLTKLCQNHYSLRLFKNNKEKLLHLIYTQLSNYIELYNQVQNEDTPNELIDLISKQESDTYLCSIVRLFVAMCSYVRQFTYIGYLLCAQVLNTIFQVEMQQINIVKNQVAFYYDPQEINNINQIIKVNQTLPITQLQASLILLTSMKIFIVDQEFTLKKLENLLRIHLNNLTSQMGNSSFKIIFMLFLQKYQKKIFKQEQDEDFNIQYLKYILQQITTENVETATAISVFQMMTKSSSNYTLLENTIQHLNPYIQNIISKTTDIDFFESLINLAKVHKTFFHNYSESYLIVLQQRIIIEINNLNNHAVIKMLQTFRAIYKIWPQEETYNSQLDVWKLMAYLPQSKRNSFDEELVEISKIFLKYYYKCQYEFVIQFVIYQLKMYLQQAPYIKFLAAFNKEQYQFIADEMPQLLYEIFIICLKCIEMNYLIKKVRKICRSISLYTDLFFKQEFQVLIQNHIAQTQNQSQTVFLICYLCMSNQQETEKYHDELVNRILEIQEHNVTLQNQADIFDCCYALIKLYEYTLENFDKSQYQYIQNIFFKLIDLLHSCLLLDDKESEQKNITLNETYDLFQKMIYKIQSKLLPKYLDGQYEYEFKLQQLMQAKAQFGLINTIYKQFKK